MRDVDNYGWLQSLFIIRSLEIIREMSHFSDTNETTHN